MPRRVKSITNNDCRQTKRRFGRRRSNHPKDSAAADAGWEGVADSPAGVGLVVDRVLGSHQTVIQSLGRFYRDIQIVSGATIMGDGRVALIMDLAGLVRAADLASKSVRNGKPSSARATEQHETNPPTVAAAECRALAPVNS